MNLRFAFFFSSMMIVFSVLLYRVIDLQILHGQDYVALADENRFYTQVLPARRGVLLDRYGDPLVWNIQKYYEVRNPQNLYQNRTLISREEALKKLATDSASVTTDTERFYRYPTSLAHTVGYVGEVTAEDLTRDNQLHISQQIGKAGLELSYESLLRGIDGKVVYEINALAEKQRVVKRQEPQAGNDITTSLDPYLSEIIARELSGVTGTVVVTDVTTGKVVALSSQPAFDPNLLSRSMPDPVQELSRREQVKMLFSDPRKLFFNRAISGAYPPGSVFKLAVALAGLQSGKVSTSTQVDDQGTLKVGEFEYGNWYFRQFGKVEGLITLVRAIARSNDIYFYKVAEWIGPEKLAELVRLFGFGKKTGIELPAETRGFVPDPNWKEQQYGEKWFLGNTYHFGIGQGYLLTSPIQVAQMTQAIGGYGKFCQVSVIEDKQPECQEIHFEDKDITTVISGMIQACSSGGTAYPFFPYNSTRAKSELSVEEQLSAGAVACKTGTAEFGGEDAKGYRKTHAWFTMLVDTNIQNAASSSSTVNRSNVLPLQSLTDKEIYQLWVERLNKKSFPKKIAITVLVESDDKVPFREGSRDAGPIAKKILDWLHLAEK